MINQKLVCFFLLLVSLGYTQEITIANSEKKVRVTKILESFQTNHQFNFSFDADTIKDVIIDIDQNLLSIEELQSIIEKQTRYRLQKINDTSYIVVENDTLIEVCGVVLDDVTSFELVQADIIKNKSTVKLTDNSGSFTIQLRPGDSLTLSHLGYYPKSIAANAFSNACDTIRLQPKIENLNQVVIKEYLTRGIQKNEDASVKISTKELRILPGLVEPDVLQSLQLLPGISSPTEDPAGLYIRGGTPDQNLVLWDGIKMYHTGHFFDQISTFNPYIVESVNVYRGGTSVRYGDRLSGVIEIESANDLTDRFQAGGGLNLTHGDLFVKVPLSEKVGIMLAGRRSSTDIYQNISYNNLVRKVFQNTRANIPENNKNGTDEMEKDDFSFSDSNFKFVWKPNDNHTFKASTLFVENRLDIIRDVESETRGDLRLKDVLKLRNFGSSINWTANHKGGVQQYANFYVSLYDKRYTLNVDDRNPSSFLEFDRNIVVKDIGGEYSINIPFENNQQLGVGYQFTYNENDNEAITDERFDGVENPFMDEIKNQNNSHTLYLEYLYKTPKSYLSIGLRNSLLSNTNRFLAEPRIFSSFEIFKDFRITASAELKNQQLNRYLSFNSTAADIGFLPVADDFWVNSGSYRTLESIDISLPVFRSSQFTFGSLYSFNGWNIDVEAYYKRLGNISSFNNLILDIALSDSNQFVITGEENRIGVDLLIKKRIKNYRFWLGYSLSNTEVKFPDVQETFFPGNFDQRHVFNISQTLKVKDFEFSLGWNYATGRPFTNIVRDPENFAFGVRIDEKGINRNRFKDYHRLDASVLYRFNPNKDSRWKGMVGFSLRNIYDRKNTISQGFLGRADTQDLTEYIESFQRESLRFTPDFVVRFSF